MVTVWLFALGFAALIVLGAWCGFRLRSEYRTHHGPTLMTVAGVWVLYSLHFGLTLIAATDSTWSFPLPRSLSVGRRIFGDAYRGSIALKRIGISTRRNGRCEIGIILL